ncbi:transposase [Streptomyces sp. NPDC048425]|uniref:transposase n=1 Tax=Streptomyces sp. NPDC048425 TaxID=3365548 RepID=UPI00371D880A
MTTGITNAASEGNNRLIKREARNAFGFRNRENQRLRSRCATTPRNRRDAHPTKFKDPCCWPAAGITLLVSWGQGRPP